MRKLLLVSIVAFLLPLLISGCGRKEKSNEATLKSASLEASKTDGPTKEPAEYSSSEEIKKDVERFQEALSSQDAKKCEAIIGSDLKKRCMEKFTSQ